IEVYPDRVDFLDFAPGETTDVTVPIDDFLIDFFTSGSLSAPEPIEFLAVMVGAGGSGRVLNKTDFLMGVDSDGPPVRVDAGYDIPLVNGIDLKGAGVPTGMRFQLFDLEMFDSDALPGSTMRAHFRYEVLGNRIPEPASVSMLGLGVGVALVCGRRRVRRNSRHRSPTNEPAATPMP
ncbi:MAG: PEP-CTERM sorting domain-containing protein, partial [Planctomycetota bacterium]